MICTRNFWGCRSCLLYSLYSLKIKYSYNLVNVNWIANGKNEVAGPKREKHSAVDVFGGESKVRCCKEQCCTGTWNLRSMNQGKLDMIKQKMVKVNIDTLGISELKRTGMGELSSDDHYIYYCGNKSLRRNGVALIVNRRIWNAILGCNLRYPKNDKICKNLRYAKMTEWSWYISKVNHPISQ